MYEMLEAMKDAWDRYDEYEKHPTDPKADAVLVKRGAIENRDEDEARKLADEFVNKFRETNPILIDMAAKGDDTAAESACVRALEVFRDAGMEESMWTVQAWLWHKFEPKDIGSEISAVVRTK